MEILSQNFRCPSSWREGVGHEVLGLVQRGGSCNFKLPSGGGSPYFLLTTNETVDYTCYIKHNKL